MGDTPYSIKLRDPRWQRKKSTVMIRDNFQCQICESTDHTLNVHHLAYAPYGFEPWDVPDSALLTLCEECHENEERYKKLHQAGIVRAFGYVGCSNSDLISFYNPMAKIATSSLDKEQFRNDLEEFLKAYAERVSE